MMIESPSGVLSMEEALKDLFKNRFSEEPTKIFALKSEGSDRKIYRIDSAKRTVVGVANSDLPENKAFLEFSKHLRASGIPAPEIYAQDNEKGIYLEEDLGDLTLFKFLSQNRKGSEIVPSVMEAYKQVVRFLPQIQIKAGKTMPYEFCTPRASFDKQSMVWDLSYFKYYFLRLAHIVFDEQALENDFDRLSDFLLQAPRDFFLYRDFQSRNVMIKDGKPYFIDYQGGRKGALQYDIASLLYDAKADLPFAMRDELLKEYLNTASEHVKLDKAEFMKYYHGYIYIRIMQAMGAYGLRGFYERKSHFLQSIPFAIRNLEYLQRTVELPIKVPELMRVMKSLVGSSYLRQIGAVSLKMTVRVHSFSYKNGMPNDDTGHGGGYVFDCRALPNPGRFDQYKKMTGKDKEVISFFEKEPEMAQFISRVCDMVGDSVVNYQKRNFTDLMVAFGCTGGQHRSVYCAEMLAKHLKDKLKIDVELKHREVAA